MNALQTRICSLAAAKFVGSASPTFADASKPWSGGAKLLTTDGVSQIESIGSAGLVPWALIAAHGTQTSAGVTIQYIHVRLSDFTPQTR